MNAIRHDKECYSFYYSLLYSKYGIAPKTLSYLAVQSFHFERHLMKVIPETRRAH